MMEKLVFKGAICLFDTSPGLMMLRPDFLKPLMMLTRVKALRYVSATIDARTLIVMTLPTLLYRNLGYVARYW